MDAKALIAAIGGLVLLTGSTLAQTSTLPLWSAGEGRALYDEKGTPSLNLYTAAEPNGCAVVVCPGGGYGGLAKDHEGHQIAQWFNERGVTAVVLHYRLGSQGHHFPAQLADVQRAIRTVRGRASEWKVDADRVGVMGFSAGGHLASMASTKFGEKAYKAIDALDEHSARPDFSILCYPVISMDTGVTHGGSRRNLLGPDKKDDAAAVAHVSSEKNITADTPPTFLFHTDADTPVPPMNSILYYMGLKKHNIPAEIHIYQNGPHGVGLYGGDPILSTWSGHLDNWLRSNGWYAEKKNVERAKVSGAVSLDGQPVSWGTITFTPYRPGLPIVTVRIRNGKFAVRDRSAGPVIGHSQVSFSASIWETTGAAKDRLRTHDQLAEFDPSTVQVEEGATYQWALESK